MRITTLQIAFSVLMFSSNAFSQSSPDSMRISLQPGQNKAIKITEPLCLEFTSDYRTKLYLFGQSDDWTFPKRTKYVVEAADYLIENPGPATLEFKLTSVSACSD